MPVEAWAPHRVWTERPSDLFAHNLTGATPEAGFDTGAAQSGDITKFNEANRMVRNAWYPSSQLPDTPFTPAQSLKSSLSGDFDNGIGNIKDGPYINKPDEGNLSVGQMWYGNSNQFAVTRNAYFLSNYLQFPPRNSFFTPNRLLPSPVMFGSLPTGVFGSKGDSEDKKAGVPWRTLLFRPGTTPGLQQSWRHVGSEAPMDHYFLDLFWMPVVEPYAISDNFSTAGKINLNYQMLGFPHITRATALHAAMKGEIVSGFSSRDTRSGDPKDTNTVIYKTARTTGNLAANSAVEMWDKDWHRHINIPATLRQLENRFYSRGVPISGGGSGAFNGLLRTASQLCELHLVPMSSTDPTRAQNEGISGLNDLSGTTAINTGMSTYWRYNNLTGDNTRERPYASLYQKFTTRSNTFRVYFISQTIRKAKSVNPSVLDESKDSVTAEYRGSALIERYLGSGLPDYAANESVSPFSQPSLENFYHYRILEMKQFSP